MFEMLCEICGTVLFTMLLALFLLIVVLVIFACRSSGAGLLAFIWFLALGPIGHFFPGRSSGLVGVLFTWYCTAIFIIMALEPLWFIPDFIDKVLDKAVWFSANLLWKLRKNNSNPIVARLLYGAAIIMTPMLEINDHPYAQGLTFLDVKEWKKEAIEDITRKE